jgi:hypothetical protein
MRESSLRRVLVAHKQTADKADAVLLDSYAFHLAPARV